MNHDSEFWSQMTLTDEMVARAISGGEGFRGKGQMATVLEDQRRKVGFQEEVAFGTGPEGWAEPKNEKWKKEGQQIGEERGFSGCEAW